MRSPSRLIPLCVILSICACAGGRRDPLESAAILQRPAVASSVEVRHILLGWSWLESGYRQRGLTLDERAQARTETKAGELAASLLARVQKGEPMVTLMRDYSEDGGSAKTGLAYTVTPDSPFAYGFKELALRLQPGEAGLVKTEFGFHVMQRVK